MDKDQILDKISSHAKPRIISPAIVMDGFAAELALKGEDVKVLRKGWFTSLSPGFYLYSKAICNTLGLEMPKSFLVRSNASETKIFEDNFPIQLKAIAKKKLSGMSLVYQSDLVDITGMSFKDDFADVNPLENEKVICLISIGYMHGLYFDLTGTLNPEIFQKEMGHLYRRLDYSHIYLGLANGLIDKLIEVDWFPFVQFLGSECEQICLLAQENKAEKITAWLNEVFTNERVAAFTSLWTGYPSYQNKKSLLEEGLNCFRSGSYGAAISTLTPLVEGLFNDYLVLKTGKGLSYNSEKIVESIYETAKLKGDSQSLLLFDQFKEYLLKSFYKHNRSDISSEATRHAVSHGRVLDEAFTRDRALRLILIIDQLFFYMDK